MINFIGVMKCGSGTASYHVQTTGDESYLARLIKSTSGKTVPKEILIASTLLLQPGTAMEDAITNKLISTIMANKLMEAHADGSNYIN